MINFTAAEIKDKNYDYNYNRILCVDFKTVKEKSTVFFSI